MTLNTSLRVILFVAFCHTASGQQDNRPKNIKMLFVPSDVMKTLRKNLTLKDLPAGLSAPGAQRWSPVHLPGDKTHSFEIRINPRAAHKLNMNFQHIKVGRGEGLLLELRNVTLTTKGKTMLDRLIEFYKNCGSRKPQRLRPPKPSLKHSLLLPGDIPLLKRIQNALSHFFPKRHDGSVDVYQHKDSNGAVHFLPFDEVRKQVNSLIRRTLVRRDCVKISSHALTQALEAFRRQAAQQNATPTEATVGEGEHEYANTNNDEGAESNENSDENEDTNNNNMINSNNNNNNDNENNNENDNNDNSNNENNNDNYNNNDNNNNRDESYTENEGQDSTENTNNSDDININNNNNNVEGVGNINAEYTDNYGISNNDMTSFSRNLDILNSPAHYKGNTTSSATLNVPSDSTATKIVTALADLRKEIKVLTSNFKQNQQIPSDGKEDGEGTTENWNNGNNISSSDKEGNSTKVGGKFDLTKITGDGGEVKNRLKKMSSDDTDDKGVNKNPSKERENNASLSRPRPLNASANATASLPNKAVQGKEVKSMMNITNLFSNSISVNGSYKYEGMQKVGLLNETTDQTANKLVNPTIKQLASQNFNQPANQAVGKPNNEYVNHTIVNQVLNRQPVNQAVGHEAVSQAGREAVSQADREAVNQADREAVDQTVDHESGNEAVEHETVNQTVDHESVHQAVDHESVSKAVDQEPVIQAVDKEIVNQASGHQRFNQAVYQPASQAINPRPPDIQAFTPQHIIDAVKPKAVNQSHRVAALKDGKVEVEHRKIHSPIAHSGTKDAESQAKMEETKDSEQAVHIKDPEDPAQPSIIFHYKPRKVKEKPPSKDENDDKTSDDKDASYEDSIKERFRKIRRLRRPRIKEMVLQDDDDSDNENHGKMYDVPEDVNYDEDGLKARLLRKLRRLRIRHRFTHGRKSPKLRVVVYDDEYEDKEPHDNNWRDTESEEFSQKIHDEDNDPVSEPTMHRSDSVLMDDDSTQDTSQQYDQPESRNPASDTDSDIQELSDSIGEDSRLTDKSDRGDDTVPDLEPYLKKNYEDEEDEENEEIKMYNDQDGIDARKLTKIGDSEANSITKPLKDVDTVVTEKTQNLENDENDSDAPSKIRIHKLPFKIQEDSDGVDTSLLKEQAHDPLGMQQVLTPPGYPSIASSPAMSVSSNPPATTNPNGLDLSANVVMPPEQSTILTGDNGQLAQMNNAFQMPRPNVPATFTGLVNYQPSVTTQMNSMMPQTPFPQVGSIMPMQPRPAEVATPMTPVMQPGQMRASISGGPKAAPKLTETGVRKTLTPKDPKSKKRVRQRGVFVSKNERNKSQGVTSRKLTSRSKKLAAKRKI